MFVWRRLLRRVGRVASTIDDVLREVKSFEARLPPYDQDTALERLRGRIEPMLAMASQSSASKPLSILIMHDDPDIADLARRLAEALSGRGVNVDNPKELSHLGPGESFGEAIERRIRSAAAILFLIGPNWLAVPAVSAVVQAVIARARVRSIAVVPVLVNGATMPAAERLPPALQSLTERQPALLDRNSWDSDIEQLYVNLQRIAHH
jgi:hypothetical protein